MKHIKKQIQRGLLDPNKDDPFELFISSTDIRYTYYKESEKILGQTFGMCILQVRHPCREQKKKKKKRPMTLL
jgi:N-acetyltransferase 10